MLFSSLTHVSFAAYHACNRILLLVPTALPRISCVLFSALNPACVSAFIFFLAKRFSVSRSCVNPW